MNRITETMIISLLLIIAMPMTKLSAQVSTWDGTWEPWTHGTGTEVDPFLIENAQQLAYLAYRVNNGLDANGGHVSNHDYHYKLMVDVNLNGSETFQWTPIGYWNSDADYQCFGGNFDGNDHEISGLYVKSSANRVGFLGNTEGVIVKNLSLSGDTISTSVGYMQSTNCINYAGGIIGYATGETIIIGCSINFSGCIYSSCSWSESCPKTYSGGLVGFSNGTITITNCINNGGSVSSVNTYGYTYNGNIYQYYSYSGGLIGLSTGTTFITNCYNMGDVSSSSFGSSGSPAYSYAHYKYSYSGGIIGYSIGTTTIANCYNTGTISTISTGGGNDLCFPGGIIGYGSSTVTNSFYLNTCEGNNTYGGTPMSSNAMQTQEFVETLNDGYCAWKYDYNNTNAGYPILTGVSVSAVTKPATSVTTTSAILNGSIIVENTNVITKGFEYRAIGAPNYTTIDITGNNNSFSYNVNGLPSNMAYEYRTFVRVTDCESIAYGSTETFELSLLNGDTIYINDSNMLCWVSEQCNNGFTFEGKYIKLMNDITLPLNVPNNMTSIGSYPDHPFKGTFDGNGKLIINLYIDQPNTPYQGFFGYTLNANLYNVGLVNITASGRNYTGGMVAYAANTNMRDCYVNGGTLFALSYCGGLVGYQDQGTNSIISGCYNTCEVTGNNYVGGLVGFSNYTTVRNSYVASMVAAQGEAVGAIIGGANEVLMYNCYFNAELTGQTNAIGWNNTGKDGGESMTSAQMRDPQFVATLNQGLSTPVWKADYAVPINKGFPILKWQGLGTIVNESNSVGCTISPNPTNGKVTIEAENLKHISISNMLGQIVYDGDAIGNAFEYDFSKYKMGIYLIRIETTSGVATKRVVVTRGF